MSHRYGCSEREWSIVERIEQGLTRAEIAEELDIGESSVRVYVQRLCEKFSCRTAAEIPQAVRQLGSQPSENSEVA